MVSQTMNDIFRIAFGNILLYSMIEIHNGVVSVQDYVPVIAITVIVSLSAVSHVLQNSAVFKKEEVLHSLLSTLV